MSFKKIKSIKIDEGEGASVKRLFPNENHNSHHDPFVLMDEFFVEAPASFPEHEHRGFEAITYMLAGSFVHKDNQGNKSEVKKEGIQAFNAGRSIIHSEKPGEEGISHGIQLWVNLPEGQKKSDPSYQSLEKAKIIEDKKEYTVKQILGEKSPITLKTEVNYLDINIKKGNTFNYSLDNNKKGFVYLITGEIDLEEKLQEGQGILLPENATITVKANKDSQFLIISGKPHNQDIKIKGSFVL